MVLGAGKRLFECAPPKKRWSRIDTYDRAVDDWVAWLNDG